MLGRATANKYFFKNGLNYSGQGYVVFVVVYKPYMFVLFADHVDSISLYTTYNNVQIINYYYYSELNIVSTLKNFLMQIYCKICQKDSHNFDVEKKQHVFFNSNDIHFNL